MMGPAIHFLAVALAIALASAPAQGMPGQGGKDMPGQEAQDRATPAGAVLAAAPAPATPDSLSILGGAAKPGPAKPDPAKPGAQDPAPAAPDGEQPAAESEDGKAHKDDPAGLSQTVDIPARPALAFSAKAEWDDGYAAISAAVARLRREMARLGLAAGGPPLAVYLDSDDAGFRFDALLPLAGEPAAGVEPGEGVRLARNPGGRAIKFEHRGPYSQIEFTYQAITVYLDQQDLHAQEFFIEEFADETGAGDAAGAMGDPENPRLTVNIYVFLK